MSDLQYIAPVTLQEAAKAFAGANNPVILAGGTDLLVQWHNGAPVPSAIINVKKIPELIRISSTKSGLKVGAAVTCAAIAEFEGLRAAYPGLTEAAQLIGSVQVQNRCSLGGNLCNASPAADTVPALIVNQAQCRLYSDQGERWLAVEDFVLGPGRTALKPGEILVEITLPANEPGTADAYLRMIPRSEMDIAVAGAAVKLRLDASGVCTWARVAIGAVAPRALLVPAAAAVLTGKRVDEPVMNKLQQAVRAAADPITDRRGTRDYRLHVIGVLAKRAAISARERSLEKL